VAEHGKDLTLETVLAILRRRAWVIVVCIVAVAGLAFALSKAQTKEYTATANLLFRDSAVAEQAAGVPTAPNVDPQRETDTNVALVELGTVADRAAANLHAGLSGLQVLHSVDVRPEGATDIAAVSATDHDPQRAAGIANAFAQAFIAERQRTDKDQVLRARALVERQIAELTPKEQEGVRGQTLIDRSESLRILASLQTGNAELVQRASPPHAPSSPKVRRNTVIGGFLGGLLGLAIAFLLYRLDRRLREPHDLEEIFDLPLLGVIPESASYSASAKGSLPPREAEAFRMLRANMRYLNVDRDIRTIVVTSAVPGEGKTTVATYLAHSAATMGARTLLIEADLRRPTLRNRLGLDTRVGLGEVLIGASDTSDAVRRIDIGAGQGEEHETTCLDLLPVGGIPPNPAGLIESDAMADLLRWAAAEYDFVLIDTPPLTAVSDAISLLRRVDGVLIVSRLGMSTTDAASHLRERLTSLGAPVLGVVANGYSGRKGDDYGYYYHAPEATMLGRVPTSAAGSN
jgi:polysaccharide biosynthesis transport protein